MKKVKRFLSIGVLSVILGISVGQSEAAPPPGGYPMLPDPNLTPGAIFNVGTTEICQSGYSSSVRNVSTAVKNRVYAEYGIRSHDSGEYEVDHLISLELGGSNDISNLWPQAYVTSPYNARVKDKLENKLHSLVCSGRVSLPEAQHAISTNWIDAYNKYINY